MSKKRIHYISASEILCRVYEAPGQCTVASLVDDAMQSRDESQRYAMMTCTAKRVQDLVKRGFIRYVPDVSTKFYAHRTRSALYPREVDVVITDDDGELQ
jgi:hypothetical protein